MYALYDCSNTSKQERHSSGILFFFEASNRGVGNMPADKTTKGRDMPTWQIPTFLSSKMKFCIRNYGFSMSAIPKNANKNLLFLKYSMLIT